MVQTEYSACQIRKLLQQLFPHRRLVLSQFTFFNQTGMMSATGESFRRGRRCYRLHDILSIACMIALKEEGIPYKNVESVPGILKTHSEQIFRTGPGCRLAGFETNASLTFPGHEGVHPAVEAYLERGDAQGLFWSIDVGELAMQLQNLAAKDAQELRRAA